MTRLCFEVVIIFAGCLSGTGCILARRLAWGVFSRMEANVVSLIIVAVIIASFMLNWVILIE